MQGASWLAGLCFLLFAGTVQALELGKQRSDYQASPDLRWLEAAPGELSPEQALEALRSGKGQRLGSRYPAMGFREQDQWFLLSLDNQSDTGLWYLRAGRPHLDYLDLYIYDATNAAATGCPSRNAPSLITNWFFRSPFPSRRNGRFCSGPVATT